MVPGIFMGVLSLELWSHTASSTTKATIASFKHQSSSILMPWHLLLQVSGVEFHIDLATWSKNRLPGYCHGIPQWKITSVTSIKYESYGLPWNTPTVAQLQVPKYKSQAPRQSPREHESTDETQKNIMTIFIFYDVLKIKIMIISYHSKPRLEL